MKFPKLASISLASLLLTFLFLPLCVKADIGFDTWAATRTIVFSPMQNFSVLSVGVSNAPVDMTKFNGTCILLFNTLTNSGTTGGTITATLDTSSDTTNWTAMVNYALITGPTADIITNFYYAGGSTNGIIATNQVALPGTVTAVTASSSGWSTAYLSPLPFTNSGAITLNGHPFVAVGIRVPDQAPYWDVQYTTGGTITNFTGNATLTGPTRF